MARLTMLVTSDGQWVLPGTSEFLEALGDPEPDYDSISFAIRNLGFIKFEIIEHSIIEIELHPRNVDMPALLAVQHQLLTSQVKLFRIRYLDDSWHSEISSSVEQTVARLSEICMPVQPPQSTNRFLIEPKDYTTLFDIENNPMRPLAQKWRISFGHFDPNIIPLAITHQLLPRFAIIGVKPHDNEPTFRFIGDAHGWLGKKYQFNGIGEKVANMPDKEYGTWSSEFFKSVASTGRPRYDFISASIQYEDEAGTPRRMVHYERLLLPWKTSSDEVFVTSCAKIVDKDAAAELASSEELESSSARKFLRSS